MPTKKISSSLRYLSVCSGIRRSTHRQNTHSWHSSGDKLSCKLISWGQKISIKRDKCLSLEKLSTHIWICRFMSRSQLPVKKMLKCKEVIELAVWSQIADTFSHSKRTVALLPIHILLYFLFIPSIKTNTKPPLWTPKSQSQTDEKCLVTRQCLGKNRVQKQEQLLNLFSFKLKTLSLQRNHSFASQIDVTWPWTSWAAQCSCSSFLSAVRVCTVCTQSLAFNCLLLPISFVNK